MNVDKSNFYDLVININSILGFLKGWEIIYSNEGEDKALYAKRNPTKIYSVIGNKDRGKSFILSKIAKRDLPYGFNVTTKGLSISFPSFDNIALLDSVGFESPLLECDGEEYILKSEDEKQTKNFYEKMNKLKEEIKNLRKSEKKLKIIRDKENEYFNERNKFRKSIKNKEDQIYSLTNERRITDFFLQRFIIENANILLLVVGKLSIDDQFFLNKLTRLIKENHEQFLQKIIVIHNLMTMKHIHVVKKYIEETLEKSLTFTLKKKDDLLIKGQTNKKYNITRYQEENDDSTEKEIIHLIMAQEGTEAGDYYNESSINFIRKTAKIITNAKPFDIIDKLKNYFCKVSETILKFEDRTTQIKPELINNEIKAEHIKDKIKSENIKLVEGNKKLQLDYKRKLELETFYGDLITDTFGDPKFTPSYHIVSTDSNYIKIYLDCPGKTEITEVNISFPNQITKVIIKGKREKQNIKTMGKKFGSGNFELKIILKGKEGEINPKYKVLAPNNGFYLILIEKLKKD